MRRAFSRSLSLLGLALALLCGGWPSVPVSRAARFTEDGFLPGEVNVKLAQAADLATVAAAFNLDPQPIEQFGSRPIFRLRIRDGSDPRDKAAALRADTTRVLLAEPNYNAGAPGGSGASWSIGAS